MSCVIEMRQRPNWFAIIPVRRIEDFPVRLREHSDRSAAGAALGGIERSEPRTRLVLFEVRIERLLV